MLGPWWYYIPWAKRVNAGKWEVDGKKVGRKLTALELVGPLVFLVAGRRLVRGKNLKVWIDTRVRWQFGRKVIVQSAGCQQRL